jgi:type III secretion protein C
MYRLIIYAHRGTSLRISLSWESTGARVTLAATTVLSAICAPANTNAAEPEWPTDSYAYIVVDQDLRTVLEQFGVNTGLGMVLSDAVQGRVQGRLPSAPPHQFLNHLTEMFGLDWYYDGVAIAVSAKSEAKTEVITLKHVSFSEFERALESAGFIDRRYQLRAGPDKRSVIASGPPRYLADVRQLAAGLSPAAAAPTQVMIIRGSSVSRVEFP